MTTATERRRHADREPSTTEALLARVLAPLVVVGALIAGPATGLLAAGSLPVLALLAPLLLVPVLLWKRPWTGVLVLLAACVTVEQFGYVVGDRPGAVTSMVPFFRTLTPGSGVSPLDVLLLLTGAVWVMRAVQDGRRLLHPSPVLTRLALLCGLSIIYLGVGLQRGGALKPALWEVKPLLYLAASFVLASELLTARWAVRVVLWIMVVGSGVKAAYGLMLFLATRHLSPRPEAVLGHEESYFFGVAALLTVGLWAFRVRGPLRVVATCLLPLVLLGAMANSRRTAWAILICGSVLMATLAYVRQPQQRKGLRRGTAVVLVFSAIYLPLSWNGTGATAQPARAVRSLVAPDARDASSDQYRLLEDANLAAGIRAVHSTGAGYGLPIDYSVARLPDLTGISSMLAYIPHNGVLWLWLRLGLVGQVLFWLMIAEAVMAACRLTAAKDRETALFGAVVACALLAYVVMGHKDLGLFWFRMACCMGVLMGLLVARTRAVALEEQEYQDEPDPGPLPEMPRQHMGSSR